MGGPSSFFIMTHVDSATHNIQLVSSLLYSYWLFTSEYLCLVEASTILIQIPRALSPRNLISGFECKRVFPAGVRPGSPSRDAVNWRSSRSSRSVETRRWYS